MTNYTPYNTPQFRDGTGGITQPINDKTVKLATTEFVHKSSFGVVVELDFGNSGKAETKFNVINANISTSDFVKTELAYLQPTGKSLDEVEMDSFFILSKANNGSTDILIRPLNGTVHGKFKFRIQIVKG